MLGFVVGVMIVVSFWLLLVLAIDLSEWVSILFSWLFVVLGFMGGGLFMVGVDKVLFYLYLGLKMD